MTGRGLAAIAAVVFSALVLFVAGPALFTTIMGPDSKKGRVASEVPSNLEGDTSDAAGLGRAGEPEPADENGAADANGTVRRAKEGGLAADPEGSADIGTPEPVQALSVTMVDGDVVVSWSAPSPGSAPIIDYDLRYAANAESEATVESGIIGTSRVVTGLRNGATYRFQVRARNALGFSRWGPDLAPQLTPAVTSGGAVSVQVIGIDSGSSSLMTFALRAEWEPVPGAESYRVRCVKSAAPPVWVSSVFEVMRFFDGTAASAARTEPFEATTTATALRFVDGTILPVGYAFGNSTAVAKVSGSAMPGATYSCTVTPQSAGGSLPSLRGWGGMSESGLFPSPEAPQLLHIVDCVLVANGSSSVTMVQLSANAQRVPAGGNVACRRLEFNSPAFSAWFSSVDPVVDPGVVQCTSPAGGGLTTMGITYLDGTFDHKSVAALYGARADTTYSCRVATLGGASVTTARIRTAPPEYPGPPNVPLASTLTGGRGTLSLAVSQDDEVGAPDPMIGGELFEVHCTRSVGAVVVGEFRKRVESWSLPWEVPFPGVAAGTWECSTRMVNDRGAGAPVTASAIVNDVFDSPTDVEFLGMAPEQDGTVLIAFAADPNWVTEPDRRALVTCSGTATHGGAAYFDSQWVNPSVGDDGRFVVSAAAQYNATYSCSVQTKVEGDTYAPSGTPFTFTTEELLPVPGAPTIELLTQSGQWSSFRVTPGEGSGTVLAAEVSCGYWGWYPLTATDEVWEGSAAVGPSGAFSCVARVRTVAGYSPESAPISVEVLPPTPPGVPENIAWTWTAENGPVATWDAPVVDGGGISAYRVYIYTDPEGTELASGIENPQRIMSGVPLTGLDSGQTYYVRVTTESIWGLESELSSVVGPMTIQLGPTGEERSLGTTAPALFGSEEVAPAPSGGNADSDGASSTADDNGAVAPTSDAEGSPGNAPEVAMTQEDIPDPEEDPGTIAPLETPGSGREDLEVDPAVA